ncbi:hypothetical protein B6U91_00145 [Candidatus Pacearchaeota archaeon ex4484_71]|nr:MAG: hypothetical protein B6U91_00145 [Candidatus Pacearchaeota archaeon ex4484_71]
MSPEINILVFVSSNCPHCPPAERLVREVSQDYADKGVIFKKIRTKTPEGKELSRRYNIMGTPTTLFMDEEGNELKRIVGVPSESNLRKKIETFLGMRQSFVDRIFGSKTK